ncbi:M56 family metallopeptidase [Winogradskyella undariae]|uniref:M56 family metallopeptidase n=1 Tax=Winogradskyella undariae TaxID=1285465 RepID=UPI0015CB8A3A|nr:M56 family metallopeptidase [Winogradskyella undariae]
MLYTILQIIAFQALFLLVYDLFLKRETFFNYNRAYLMLTSVLSLILPFVKFPTLKKLATKDMVIHLPEVFIGAKTPTAYDIQIAEQVGIILEQPKTPIWQIVALSGIGIATLIFLIKITKLYWVKYKNSKRWKGNVLIVNLIKSNAAYSFFNTIFLGERISEREKSTIYEHEMVHIKELHSLDLLFFELLRIIFWFNPLVYIYQNRIKELHEYIADAKAVKQSGKSEYYKSLLNQVLDVNQASFTNAFFNTSLIKKRIAMLQKSKSKQLHLIKYALLIPMLFGMLIYTSTEVRAQEKIEIKEALNQELNDAQQIERYYGDIIELAKDEINNYSIIDDKYNYSLNKFIPTKQEFLRYVAYMRFMGERFEMYARKSDRKIEDIERFAATFTITKSYDEHLAYLKTDEAEKSRKELTYNRTLQVISEDIDNLTEEEHKDAYEKVIDVIGGRRFYRRLIIKDNKESVEITNNNYDPIIRFFSTDEIKTLLTFVKDNEVIEVTDDHIEVPFSVIDESPTTLDCKDLKSNEDRKNCLNSFVIKHIGKTFNTDIGDNLSPGRKRVFVQFKIDTDGIIKDIVARGPSLELEVEAKRVIETLPQFIPGKQKGKVVVVPFSIPIVFQVAAKTEPKKE